MSDKSALTKVSDAEATRIQALPALSTFLPFRFENGATVDGLTVNCAACGGEIGSDSIQAEIDRNNHNISVKAYGVCLPCKVLTPLEVRLRDDGTMILKAGDNWFEGRYAKDHPVGVIAWLKTMMSKLVIK